MHITNGDSFDERLQQLDYGDFTRPWREMLCEGPTTNVPFSDEFISLRKSFLLKDRPEDESIYNEFINNFQGLHYETFDRIVMWFEYDLFCHINLAAALSYLRSFTDLPVALVCSGRISGREGLFGLNELDDTQLDEHYRAAVTLEESSEELLLKFWELYNDADHRKFQQHHWLHPSLPYLKPCVEAHLQRFPSERNGLNKLENMVLEAIQKNQFQYVKNCLGYLLMNQDHYGFGDLQWARIIMKMMPLINTSDILSLSLDGQERFKGMATGVDEFADDTQFGGALKYDYVYTNDHQLVLR